MCKISIIIPVYNSSKYLKKCLDSLVNQTVDDIEIIMVNDGSTDNSEKIIKEYQKQDKRIKLINKQNGGQASARNLGLKQAKGEYISFIDSDDYVDINLCKDTLKKATNENYDIVVFDYYIVVDSEEKYNKVLKNNKTGKISQKDFFWAGACPWNKIYRKKFLIENNFSFPEGIMYEDYAAIIPLIRYNPNIYYLNKPYVYYVFTDDSTMRTSEYRTRYEDIFKANEILVNALKDTNYKEELEGLVSYHMLYLGSLNFYKYKKFEQINKISDFMKKNFPNWQKNKYVLELSKKEQILMKFFYLKKYKIIKLIQSIKRCFK